MNDLESRVRASFRDHLDEIQLASISPRVERKAQRVRQLSVLGLMSAVLATVALSILGLRAVQGTQREVTNHPGTGITPAGLGERTYVLDGFEIQYPYDDPSVNGEVDPTRAGVTYVSHWATGEYPGSVECEMDVVDAAGQQVGSLRFSLDSAADGFTRENLPVPVSAEPVSANARCARGDYAPGAGYIFEGPIDISPAVNRKTSEEYDDRLEFTFDVRWETPQVSPEMRTCYLTIVHEGGEEQDPVRFDANMGEGREQLNAYVGEPSTVETAYVTCGELEEEVVAD